MKGIYLPPLILLLLFSACIPNKKVIYLQDKSEGALLDTLLKPIYPDYQLQVGDILNIDVKSSDPTIALIFNPSSLASNQAMLANNAADVNYLNGYPINTQGTLELPLVGKLELAGLTLKEAKELVEQEVKNYITDAYIQVRLGGIRYSALGEFNRPGRYAILQSQVTIFEAIANAGDLTVLANRQKALIIRQYQGGAKLHELDLTDRGIFNSEFYYLRPNDQIYLEPLPVRQFGSGVGVTGFQTVTTLLSAISSALLIVVSLNSFK